MYLVEKDKITKQYETPVARLRHKRMQIETAITWQLTYRLLMAETTYKYYMSDKRLKLCVPWLKR